MAEISTISTKGQVVIPQDIRKELGLETGTNVVISRMDDYVILKKIEIPDIRKEFRQLTRWGNEYARRRGIRSEEEVVRLIHEGRKRT
jgi:AbrB family looped-hinge helix DNA binding protein